MVAHLLREMGEFVSVLLPVLTIEVLYLEVLERTGVDTAEVNADAVRVGARDVKRLHAAGFAEVVLCHTSVEPVATECIPRGQ